MLNRRSLSLAALALALAAPARPSAAAAADPSVSLTKAQAGQFQAALNALAAQGHVALVAEGGPLKPRLTPAAAPDLTASQPLGKAVAAVAAAYDYDVQRQDTGVFVLTKRYTDAADLPCVTLEECRLAAHELLGMVDAFSPHLAESSRVDGPDGERDAIISFFGSLTPDQAQAAQAKTLRYADLAPGQQGTIHTLFLYWKIQGPATQLESILGILDSVPKSVLTAQEEHGINGVFIQEVNPSDATNRFFAPLTGRMNGPGDPQQVVLTLPPQAGPPDPVPTTLAAVVAGLPHAGGPATVVDAPLRAKPLSVAGLAYATPKDVLQSLMSVYGLRLGATDAGTPEIERQAAPTPTTLRELGHDVWLTLPAPYARALHIQTAGAPAPAAVDPADWQAVTRQFDLKMRSDGRPREIAEAASQRVLVAMQPQIHAHGPGVRVPVSALDEPARAAVVVALMTPAIQEMKSLFDPSLLGPVLDCLDNPGPILIYTKSEQTAHVHGVTIPAIYLEGSDPATGTLLGLGGVFYSSYP